MPLIATDLVKYKSTNGLGGPRLAEQITDDVLGNLFDTVHGPEALAGDIEYRCFYWMNTHPTIPFTDIEYIIKQQVIGTNVSIEIGVGVSLPNGVEPATPDEDTAPADVVFGVDPITVGTLLPMHHQALWIKRTVLANTAATKRLAPTVALRGESVA